MPTTIPSVAVDANSLFAALTNGLSFDLSSIPNIVLDTDFEAVDDVTLPNVAPLTLGDLTEGTVAGNGVFDGLMRAVNAHLTSQYEKQRITGKDYAQVYLGAITAVMQFGTQFLLGRDRAVLENLQVLETIKLTQAQRIRAQADVQLARAQLQQAMYATRKLELETRTALNQFATTKMDLVLGFNAILEAEGKQKLTNEQFESQRAQTLNTRSDGTAVTGVIGTERMLAETKVEVAQEELDTTRANTKETLRNGGPIQGLVAIEKEIKEATLIQMAAQGKLTNEQYEVARAETKDTLSDGSAIGGLVLLKKQTAESQMKLAGEQYEIARAQIRDSLSTGGAFAGMLAIEKLMKEAQRELMDEQVDSQRAQTKDTLQNGQAVSGLAAKEKLLKDAQAKLVGEQYESQRAQTRGNLSTGETVVGLLGAQISLYNQQVTSYKRDAESKGLKMLLDTWTARKTIDDGVEVPTAIDTTALNSMVTNFRANLTI